MAVKAYKSEGLTSRAVVKQRQLSGVNRIAKAPVLAWYSLFRNQFNNPLVWLLLLAMGLAWWQEALLDLVVIGLVVSLNLVFGFWQEFKADRALVKLKQVVTAQALVFRDQVWQLVPIEELVVADLVALKTGDKVPADGVVRRSQALEVDQALLSGESEAVVKKAQPSGEVIPLVEAQVWRGTLVVAGEAEMVVTAVGSQTKFGQIALSLETVEPELTPLQLKLGAISSRLAWLVVGLAGLIFIVSVWLGSGWEVAGQLAIALAVSALPEGLLVAVTVILVLGMQRLLKQQALVRKLLAAETLGSTTLICTDKTGTLTTGQMSVVAVQLSDSLGLKKGGSVSNSKSTTDDQLFWQGLVLVNQAQEVKTGNDFGYSGNLTDGALLRAAHQRGFDSNFIRKTFPRLEVLPFNSTNKLMVTRHQWSVEGQSRKSKRERVFIKGAPEKIIERLKYFQFKGRRKLLTDQQLVQLKKQIKIGTESGQRLLLLAYLDLKPGQSRGELETLKGLVYLGLVALADSLRLEVRSTLKTCRQAGIRIVMMTGDHPATALQIASEAGFKLTGQASELLTGPQLAKLSDKQLLTKLKKVQVLARLEPLDKLRLVKLWQQAGEVVAMTGDGVNDAPAMKQANIGVALGSGSEVTKEVADLVLLDNSLAVLVSAVRQGRIIFNNIKKVVLYLLSDSFSEVILVILSLVAGVPLALSAVQILWINLINDGLPSLALTVEPGDDLVMRQAPVAAEANIFDPGMKHQMLLISGFTGVFVWLLFVYLWRTSGDLVYARTMAFATLGIDSLVYIFSIKAGSVLIWKADLFNNKWLWGSVLFGVGVQLMAVYVPFFQRLLGTQALVVTDWLVVLGLVTVLLFLIEIFKPKVKD